MHVGIYHGATGTVIKIAFVEGTPSNKYKRIPSTITEGSMAKQVMRGRPLPGVIYVQMDNDKINTDLIHDRIVPFTVQARHLVTTLGGKRTVTR